MTIKIIGAGGYLGNLIKKEFEKRGYQVSPVKRELLYSPSKILSREIANAHAIINLAGAPILKRWTQKNKLEIYESRVKTAQNIVKSINLLSDKQKPKSIISTSAIGIYRVNKLHDETSGDFDPGFLGGLVKDWESAWINLPENVNLTIFRIALVLGRNAAIIKKLTLPFKLGLGGKIGNGKQPFPFIHEADVSKAFLNAVENELSPGIYNLAAPCRITNEDFTKALAKTLHRPAIFSIPEVALKALYGEAAGLLINSPAVVPAKLLNAGFEFKYPAIYEVLKNIFKTDL
jgi:uncharacterized protein (TIGR01777 family)